MKNRFLLTLVLAGLAAASYLLWFEHSPSAEPATTGSAEQRSQPEKEGSRRPVGPGERNTAAQISARGPDAATEQAHADRPAAADVSASKPLKPTRVDRAAADFPDDEETEELVIGGLVQDEEGNPLSQFEVLAERIDVSDSDPMVVEMAAENIQSIFPDIDGAFLFRDLEDSEYRISLAPVEGIAPAQITVRTGTLNANLVVVMLRDVRVYGTVSSTDGEPIEDARVVAAPTTRSTRSGSRGEYELYINRQGIDVRHTIRFQHEEFKQQQIVIDKAELIDMASDFQLNVSMEPLNRLTTVTGKLTDTEGRPVRGEILHIITSELRTWYRAQSDARGNFLFEEVEPGKDHQLRVRPASGYKNKDINPLLVPEGGLKLDIVLEPIDGGELSGWMIDLDGNPVPGFSMKLVSTVATTHSVSVVSDQQGFFSVEDFPVGGAHFRSSSYPKLTVQGLRVSAEPEDPVTVILDTGVYMLEGWVIDGLGEPVAASSITLGFEFIDDGLRSSSSRKTTADQSGYFVFTGLGPGVHAMQLRTAGFKDAALTIDVGIDRDEIVVELEEAT
jgi:hypothetical protein